MCKIDLNSDLGESFGKYNCGNDNEILKLISSANIACGFHAGDPSVIQKTIEQALSNNVSIGAHPGFPDLQGFGRRNMNLSEGELFSCVLYQVSALKSMTEALGGKLEHVKPHGAMYNMAANDYTMAHCIAKAVQKIDDSLLFVGLANSQHIKAASDIGLQSISEAFADRRYNNQGFLVARSIPNAVIENNDQSIKQVLNILENKTVETIEGEKINLNAQSVCVHGDNKDALTLTQKLHKAITDKAYEICSMKSMI
ncbi:5-oxoprolinase subunit PxpA [Carboxylicivirga sp. N1Y90]|uniref:5-oxoprolinase subunit PxpA n=1 Tax=Carboxylicivirga fragile TaxID=3417571 RepID=UPI003D34D283|nr:LamB/YcsF family protein [Marinilabiliaceae bacterium N1Y90]